MPISTPCGFRKICSLRRRFRRTLSAVLGAVALTFLMATVSPLAASSATAALVPIADGGNGGEPATLPEGLSEAEIQEYLAALPDERVRQLLIAELAKQAKQRDQGAEGKADVLSQLRSDLETLREHLAIIANSVDQVPQLPVLLRAQVTAGGTISGTRVLVEFVLFFLAGAIAEWLYRRATRMASIQTDATSDQALASRLGVLALRGFIDFLGIVIFTLVAIAALLLAGTGPTAAALLFITVLRAIVSLRIISLVSRLILAPKPSWPRLVPLSDAGARAIYWRVMILATILYIERIIANLYRGYGLPPGASELVALAVVLVFTLTAVFIIWRARAPVAAMIAGNGGGATTTGGFRQSLARYWHVLASGYVIGMVLWAIAVAFATGKIVFGAAIASLLLPVAVVVADLGLRALVKRMFRPTLQSTSQQSNETQPETQAQSSDVASVAMMPEEEPMSSYERVALRNLRILLGILVVVVFVGLWDIDLAGLVDEFVGEQLTGSVVDLAVVLLLAYAVWGFVKAAVQRYAVSQEPDTAEPGEGEGGGPGGTRLQTLLPLFRKFLLITLVVMVVMIALSELGVNIGPLIAGAGIVGIAIGFGAQTLVRDIVSGVFFLLDDAFRMGEYVEIGNTRGRVEKISIRSLQLRHHNGPVHTIPFGEITHLTNYSRDYVIMKFELRVPFETDIDKVRKLIKKVGQEMMADPELAPLMLGPLKSQGVTHMDDSALIMRCKFTAIPGQQFMVRRAAFTRIQKAFAENGIHFAPRRVIVEATGSGLTPEQAASAAAAALGEETQKKAAGKGDDRG
ncbi:MAG: mechanosensitive ion channel domain-containing protein [Acidiferrobacterales bacterium]